MNGLYMSPIPDGVSEHIDAVRGVARLNDKRIAKLAETLQEIWHLRWAGDTECWPNMSPEYQKVWLDIATAAFKAQCQWK